MTISLTKQLLLICQYEPCSVIFTPRRPNKEQKYCSRRCGSLSQRKVYEPRECEYAACDVVFVPTNERPDKRFCTREHADLHRRAPQQPPRPCEYSECGQMFVPPRHLRDQRYHSRTCAMMARRKDRPKGICEGCGITYEIVDPGNRARRSRFHSRECYNANRVPLVACPTCEKMFRARGKQKFCCQKCASFGRVPPRPETRKPAAERADRPKRRAARGKRKPAALPKVPWYTVDLVKHPKQPKPTPWRPWEQPTRYVPDEPPKRKGSRVDQPSVTYVNTGTSSWASRAAQQTVLRFATDVADARELLAILGLDQDFGPESDFKSPRGRGHAEAVNGAPAGSQGPQRRNSEDLVQHR